MASQQVKRVEVKKARVMTYYFDLLLRARKEEWVRPRGETR